MTVKASCWNSACVTNCCDLSSPLFLSMVRWRLWSSYHINALVGFKHPNQKRYTGLNHTNLVLFRLWPPRALASCSTSLSCFHMNSWSMGTLFDIHQFFFSTTGPVNWHGHLRFTIYPWSFVRHGMSCPFPLIRHLTGACSWCGYSWHVNWFNWMQGQCQWIYSIFSNIKL